MIFQRGRPDLWNRSRNRGGGHFLQPESIGRRRKSSLASHNRDVLPFSCVWPRRITRSRLFRSNGREGGDSARNSRHGEHRSQNFAGNQADHGIGAAAEHCRGRLQGPGDVADDGRGHAIRQGRTCLSRQPVLAHPGVQPDPRRVGGHGPARHHSARLQLSGRRGAPLLHRQPHQQRPELQAAVRATPSIGAWC